MNSPPFIRALVCRVGRAPTVEQIPLDDKRSYLTAMQRIVGGTVAHLTLDDGLDCWLNDDGIALGLPLNRIIPAAPRGPLPPPFDTAFVIHHGGDPDSFAKPGEPGEWRLYGDFFLTRSDDEGEIVDIDDESIARYTERFEREDREAARRMNAAGAIERLAKELDDAAIDRLRVGLATVRQRLTPIPENMQRISLLAHFESVCEAANVDRRIEFGTPRFRCALLMARLASLGFDGMESTP